MIAPPLPAAASCAALTRRELTRFVRQPSRIVAAVGTALLFWVFAASGFSGSFVPAPGPGAPPGYGAYLLPGMATMVIVFSSVFASISLIQDRQAGFLQSVLVSPAPRWAIVASKIAGGALVGVAQASVLIVAAPLSGLAPGAGPAGVLLALSAAGLTAVAVISLGLAAAWWIDSTAGFHGVMNLVLMPAWLLSGALFPAEQAAPWMSAVMRLNPLHWCHSAIAAAMGVSAGPVGPPMLGALAFALAASAAAWAVMSAARLSRRAGGAA